MALHEIALALSSELEPRRLYEGIVQGARRLLDVPVALAGSWDPGREELVLEHAIGAEFPRTAARPAEMPVCVGRAFLDRRTVVVDDLCASPRAHPDSRRLQLRAAVATPLLRDGQPVAVIFVAHVDPARRFDVEDVRLLEILAGHAALALGNAETVVVAARRMARVEEHGNALRGIIEARRRHVVIERALDCATTVLGADRAAVYLIDPRQVVTLAAGRRLSRAYLEIVASEYPRSAGGLLQFTRAPIFVPDLQTDQRTRVLHEPAAQEGIHAALLVPLIHRDGLLGSLELYHDLPFTYGADDVAFARQLADQLTLALVNASLHEQNERQLAQLRVLEAMLRAVQEPVPADERCRRGAQAIVSGGGATSAWAFLAAPEAGELHRVAHAGAGALSDDAALELAREALTARQAVARQPAGADPLVAAPITSQGQPIGALVLATPRSPHVEARPHTTFLHEREQGDSREFVATAAGQLGTAIANARLLAESATVSARLAAVVDGLPSGILVFDDRDRVVVYNRKVLEIYGIEGKDLAGWSPADFIRMVGHCFADPAMPAEIARRVKENRDRVHRIEFQLVRPRRSVIERISAPLRMPDGPHLGQVVLYHDLTEVRDAELAKSEFVSMAGLELKAPLEAARETARQLADNGHEEAAVHVERLDAMIERLGIVVDELIDLALLDSGRLELRRERIDFGALVKEVVERVRQLGPRRHLELEVPDRAVDLWADRQRLGRVLEHALADAASHAPQDTALRIRIELQAGEVAAAIASPLPRRGDADLSTPGEGFARRLSREILERHGGVLEIDAQDGVRSIRVRLPIEGRRVDGPHAGRGAPAA